MKELPISVIKQSSELFKVLGDKTRVSILYLLKDTNLNVTEIAQALDMEQSAVSHQLQTLKNARLVTGTRHKRSVYYQPNDAHVYHILQQVFEHVEEVASKEGKDEVE